MADGRTDGVIAMMGIPAAACPAPAVIAVHGGLVNGRRNETFIAGWKWVA